MTKQLTILQQIKNEPLNVHHHFAQYFKNNFLEPYLYVLSKRMENGHVCIPIDNSLDEDFINGGYSADKNNLVENELLTFASNYDSTGITELKPFVCYNNKFYLQRNFVYESQVFERLKEISQNDLYDKRKIALSENQEFILNSISKYEDVSSYSETEKVDWQAIAAFMGVINNLTIITGGPGTGKTTTVAKILSLLKRIEGDDLSIALAAPTGKAAMRMKESLMNSVEKFKDLEIDNLVEKTEAFTIHRLLGVKKDSPVFKHNSENQLSYDVIIIDEASMIGVALFAKLLAAIKSETRIILLGDSEQLASVDAGSLFGDICLSQKESENLFTKGDTDFFNLLIHPNRLLNQPNIEKYGLLNSIFVRLKKTYRFNQNSLLGAFTKAIIEGNRNQIENILENKESDSIKLDFDYNENFFKHFVLKYKAYIEEQNIIKAFN
jgi:exodeoxyribonuclease V alpha subunit